MIWEEDSRNSHYTCLWETALYSGTYEYLGSQDLSTADLALISLACEHPLNLDDTKEWFSPFRVGPNYIDYPKYLPLEMPTPSCFEVALEGLLARSVLGVADDALVDRVNQSVAARGLFGSYMPPPKLGDLVPLPLGAEIIQEVGRLLGWTWEIKRPISRWSTLTFRSNSETGPYGCGFDGDNIDKPACRFHCFQRYVQMIGKWSSYWWNTHDQGWAILCKTTVPNEGWEPLDPSSPEASMWPIDWLRDQPKNDE